MSSSEFDINDASALKHPFFECIQCGDLATAEEIAAVQLEILNLKLGSGEDVTVPLAQWQSRRTVLQLILARDG